MESNSGPGASSGDRVKSAGRVIIVGSVMFTFISYWRTAAVVLCDLGSTAYYIGGIVENAIGPAAPWYILAVMLFSYAVRSVYIESCSLFIRGGVYRVVKEAMGRFFAKIAVSALIFDYLLTGPISGVSAGQYLMGLFLDIASAINPDLAISDTATRTHVMNWGAVAICLMAIFYFFRANVRGIHESSDRALKIMMATTVMVVLIIAWCSVTLALNGVARYEVKLPDGAVEMRTNQLPLTPDFSEKEPRLDAATGELKEQVDPLGALGDTTFGKHLRPPQSVDWLSLFGLAGLLIAFGHSILAMSGEETLAQVYREVESPKLPNFRKAAMIVFLYSLVFTAGISFFAVLIIPADVRMAKYDQNLISGLVQYMVGPTWIKIGFNIFVVVVGSLILSGAVNTAIIGSNGVLNRVAEDGILPQWFLKPHPRYGTTYRLLYLIAALQVVITIFSQGDVILLGEAYAFGVVWSFAFQAISMVMLRFKDKRPREYKVPFNITIGTIEIPLGLLAVLLLLLCAAVFNLFTKELATIAGASFTLAFFLLFWITEHISERKRQHHGEHKHVEQFNREGTGEVTPEMLGLTKPFRRLVAIRSTQNLVMLEKALHDTDPQHTDLVVMTAKNVPDAEYGSPEGDLDPYDQELMTAVVNRAESFGKSVHPLIIPTNRPLYALMKTAADLKVHELVVGASNVYTADEQIEQLGFYWFNLNQGEAPLTVKILGRDREVQFDLGGGNRIPKAGEIQARNVAELRAAGVGVQHVMALLPDSPEGLDTFQSLLTALDPQVSMIVGVTGDQGFQVKMREQAEQVVRPVSFFTMPSPSAEAVIERARAEGSDLLIVYVGEPEARHDGILLPQWATEVTRRSPCQVALMSPPGVPHEVIDRGHASQT